MRGSIVILAGFTLSLPVAFVPRSACATPVACQATATSPTPMTKQFAALAADGSGQYGFIWDFGDGVSSGQQNPEHTYTQVRFYNVILTVSDIVSQETCVDTLRVVAGEVRVEIATCRAQVDVRWGQAPLTVTFDAFPSPLCGPPPYTWTWRFADDGQTSSQQSVQHEYANPGTYWAVATQHTATGSCDCFPTWRISAVKNDLVGVGSAAADGRLRLEAARPNPFGVMTTIAFDLPRPGDTRLTIHDVLGRTVAELVNDFRPAGPAISIWQGRTASSSIAPPGLYFVRLEHEGAVRSTRLVRMR